MTARSLSIIIDDKRTDAFTYGPQQGTPDANEAWFNGTSQPPPSGVYGTLSMKFNGTSVAFYGTTPSSSSAQNQTLTVSIDASASYNATYTDPNPPSYRQLYQSPRLPEGPHNISLSNLAGTSLDFAVVQVGQDTPLTGEKVIVDDDDAAMSYSYNANGQWSRNLDMFNSGPPPDGFPYGNTTHQTSRVGDNFSFRFTGKSAAIYGIFTWSNPSLLSLTFTLDSAPLQKSYSVTPTTPQFTSELGQQPNFLFYSYDFLDSGDHTLNVNVTACVNQTFAFDYITYEPTFGTLAGMPYLAPVSSATASSSGGGKKAPIGAVIGGVAALIAVFVLVGFIFWRRRRRASNDAQYKLDSVTPFQSQALPQDIVYIPLTQSQFSPPQTASSHGLSYVRSQISHDHLSVVEQRPHNERFSAPVQNINGGPGEGSEVEGESVPPPSYHESTGGVEPRTISYVIQR